MSASTERTRSLRAIVKLPRSSARWITAERRNGALLHARQAVGLSSGSAGSSPFGAVGKAEALPLLDCHGPTLVPIGR